MSLLSCVDVAVDSAGNMSNGTRSVNRPSPVPGRTSRPASLIRSVFVKQDNRLKLPAKQTKGDLSMLGERISLQYRLIWPIRRNNIGLNRIALDLVYSNVMRRPRMSGRRPLVRTGDPRPRDPYKESHTSDTVPVGGDTGVRGAQDNPGATATG